MALIVRGNPVESKPVAFPSAKHQLEVSRLGDRVESVRRYVAEAKRAIESFRGLHRGQGIEPYARVARLPCPADGRLRQPPAEPKGPAGGANVEPLHLAGTSLERPHADAPDRALFGVGQKQPARGRRVCPGQGGQLGVEILEVQIEPEARRVLQKQLACRGDVFRRGGKPDPRHREAAARSAQSRGQSTMPRCRPVQLPSAVASTRVTSRVQYTNVPPAPAHARFERAPAPASRSSICAWICSIAWVRMV